MDFLSDNCTLKFYNQEIIDSCNLFDCDHTDLNDFFTNDVDNYSKELLGKTYCFTLDSDPTVIVCAFTISNDSIKTTHLPNARKKKVTKGIPRPKQMRSYPAVLIGRLGVHKDYRSIKGEEDNTGKQLMNFIKSWFIDSANKTGCRFIVVDSYNEPRALRYYAKNSFESLFSTEEQEKEFTGLPSEAELPTRLMFFDLIVLTK
ncbi:MAG: GNAT family N-acetyltransferase [Cellulophaga sp.]